jgi:hypothetical protein
MKLGQCILFLIFISDFAKANCQGFSVGASYFSQELKASNLISVQNSKADLQGFELGYEFHFDFMDFNLQLIYGGGSFTAHFSQFNYSTFTSQWNFTALQAALPVFEESSHTILLAVTAGRQNLSFKDQPETLTFSAPDTFQRYSVIFRSHMSEHTSFDFEIGHVSPFNKTLWKADLSFLF